jgi:uncharacterized phage-like protein YoqJ
MPQSTKTTNLVSGNKSEKGRRKMPDRKKRTIGRTTYNITLVYDDSRETIYNTFLQLIKEREATKIYGLSNRL